MKKFVEKNLFWLLIIIIILNGINMFMPGDKGTLTGLAVDIELLICSALLFFVAYTKKD